MVESFVDQGKTEAPVEARGRSEVPVAGSPRRKVMVVVRRRREAPVEARGRREVPVAGSPRREVMVVERRRREAPVVDLVEEKKNRCRHSKRGSGVGSVCPTRPAMTQTAKAQPHGT
ncbi:hypothetical protein F2Q68_00031708 [Brassica cretica]|uniref:Uncharacterized protein n=1 Tax=Brassica cretica TaxID=69181 RepID=A0A8S9G893_BRACR|nr:hypothetical protein F2Q68_00031708 [Brassica cretica]